MAEALGIGTPHWNDWVYAAYASGCGCRILQCVAGMARHCRRGEDDRVEPVEIYSQVRRLRYSVLGLSAGPAWLEEPGKWTAKSEGQGRGPRAWTTSRGDSKGIARGSMLPARCRQRVIEEGWHEGQDERQNERQRRILGLMAD